MSTCCVPYEHRDMEGMSVCVFMVYRAQMVAVGPEELACQTRRMLATLFETRSHESHSDLLFII